MVWPRAYLGSVERCIEWLPIYAKVYRYTIRSKSLALRGHEDPVAVVVPAVGLTEREGYAAGRVYRVLAYEASLCYACLGSAQSVEDTEFKEGCEDHCDNQYRPAVGEQELHR